MCEIHYLLLKLVNRSLKTVGLLAAHRGVRLEHLLGTCHAESRSGLLVVETALGKGVVVIGNDTRLCLAWFSLVVGADGVGGCLEISPSELVLVYR